MTQQYQNYIAGKWTDARAGRRFQRENPANGKPTGSYPLSDAQDVNAAVCAAFDAQRAWRRMPAPKRGEILFRAGEILVRNKEQFARELTEEMGKVIKEARGDIQEAIDMTYYMAGEGRRTFGQTTPSELPDKWAMSVRAPIGVVGLITPWNFPMAIPSWKIMPALVTGNTVVFKPSQFAPKSAHNLIAALEEAGVPSGVVNLVHGEGGEVGQAIIEHANVALISFTGSNSVGKQIAVRCAELGKPVSLEMGGKNAITVLEDADLGLAVDGAVWSAFGTTGQRCTA
ncbi:MAG TPA: aldehyde dehydrogenase family protein, partial [Dehalococcoidia bacterium]